MQIFVLLVIQTPFFFYFFWIHSPHTLFVLFFLLRICTLTCSNSPHIRRSPTFFYIQNNRSYPGTKAVYLIANLLTHKADMLAQHAILESLVFPAGERRQTDQQRCHPDHSQHDHYSFRCSILYIADVRNGPVPGRRKIPVEGVPTLGKFPPEKKTSQSQF